MIVRAIAVAATVLTRAPFCWAQVQPPPEDSGTSTDVFVMLGPDFDRPGLLAKANYNVGVGHTFAFLKKNPIGDEITLAYTYKNAGPGFWHSDLASDTESVGIMKNFGLPGRQRVTGYTWVQIGLTGFTGGPSVQNRFYDGESLVRSSTLMDRTQFGSKRHITRSSPSRGIRRPASATRGVGRPIAPPGHRAVHPAPDSRRPMGCPVALMPPSMARSLRPRRSQAPVGHPNRADRAIPFSRAVASRRMGPRVKVVARLLAPGDQAARVD